MDPNIIKAFAVQPEPKMSFKMKQKKARTSGQPYLVGSKKKGYKAMPGKDPEFTKEKCKCKFKCSELSDDHRLNLFQDIHTLDGPEQNTFLLGLMTIIPVQRRRHGQYESPEDSRRQCTVTFMAPDGKGGHVRVCKKTFMAIFGIKSSKRVQNLVTKKKLGKSISSDNRGGTQYFKFTLADRNEVKAHIKSIPTEPSHYNRKHDDNEYLNQDLNINRLYLAFKEKYPASKVSYQFYAQVFHNDFPKHKFRKPRVDTCKTCDRLKIELQSKDLKVVQQAKKDQRLHHCKAEQAFKQMNTDTTNSTKPSSDTCTIVVDLQKVFPIPKLTHSDMYYARQLSVFNFGIHIADTSDAIMCIWNEKEASRGGNEMASCLFRAINNMDLTQKRKIVIWSDNCCGQIKNRMMIFLYLYLVANSIVDTIEHKFLVVGHSFSAADRNFALIEKRWKLLRVETVEEVKHCITSARHEKPYKVFDMGDKFLNFDSAAASTINTSKLNITQVSQIKIDRQYPGIVQTKKTFSDIESWQEHNVLKMKPPATMEDIRELSLTTPTSVDKMAESKKSDIRKMLPYISERNRPFFEDILT